MTKTFVSPTYGYAFNHFRLIAPATEVWDPSNQPLDMRDAFDPRFDFNETGYGAYFEGASTPLPDGVSVDEWVDEFVTPVAAGGCGVPRSQQAEVIIDGRPGRMAQCRSGYLEATAVAGRRLYLFVQRQDSPPNDGTAWFEAWLATIELRPEDAAPTATPRPTPTPQPEPPDPTPAALPEGPWVLVYHMLFGVPTTVTIPAPDWHGIQYYTGLEKHGRVGPPDGAKLVVYGGGLVVYGDPCAWESTRPDDPAASLDDFVAALSAQASRDATAPEDVTVGGYPGKKLTLHVPQDAVFADCDGGEFRTLMEISRTGEETPHVQQFPGQISEVWVVDVDGTLVFFDAGYFAATPAEDVAEMRAIVESATFQRP